MRDPGIGFAGYVSLLCAVSVASECPRFPVSILDQVRDEFDRVRGASYK